jgi:hypothetical protein
MLTPRVLALAALPTALLVSSPAPAYDPCDRAYATYIAARDNFDQFCRDYPRECRNSGPRYQKVAGVFFTAYHRMRRACANP